MENTLYIKLLQINPTDVEIRYFPEGELEYESHIRSLSEVTDIIQAAESDYHDIKELGSLNQLGARIFNWLNAGSEKKLERVIRRITQQHRCRYLILAIDAANSLAHIPWELLNDGTGYLVEKRNPTILPVRWTEGSLEVERIQYRPLRVLFMATAPREYQPVLDYEAEEALILDATRQQKINLIVEESGNLEELGRLVADYGRQSQFDVFHLNGHAGISPEKGPVFLTESEFGAPYFATADEIWNALRYPPELLFLSGCQTGAMGGTATVDSLAQSLIERGAKSVLGWGRPVDDSQAMQAAATLYNSLAVGHSLVMSVALTFQRMIAQKYPQWHQLRLFVSGTPPREIVAAPQLQERDDPAFPRHGFTVINERERRGIVADYRSFVGRRYLLQDCLRLLKSDEYAGILLYGLGGVGKSSLAHRILTRLRSNFKMVFLTDRESNRLDLPKLLRIFRSELGDRNLREQLRIDSPTGASGQYRGGMGIDVEMIRDALVDVLAQTTERYLFLIDDFEGNFRQQADGSIYLRDGQFPEIELPALEALEVLVAAIVRNAYAGHKLLITSRYQVDLASLERVKQKPLKRFDKADLLKKLKRLEAGKLRSLSETAQQQIMSLSDGNPRLLEWLHNLAHDTEIKLPQPQLEAKKEQFSEEIYAPQILAQLPQPIRDILARLAVFQMPISRKLLAALCGGIEWQQYLPRAVALGLVEEVEPYEDKGVTTYRVSQIVAAGLPAPDRDILDLATRLAYEFWWEEEQDEKAYSAERESRNREVFRLAKVTDAPRPLVDATRALCAAWTKLGKNYQEIVDLCQEVLEREEDHKLYSYLSAALFEAGKEVTIGEETLDGFRALEKALEICPETETEDRIGLLTNYSYRLRDYGKINQAYGVIQEAERASRPVAQSAARAEVLHQFACSNCDFGYYDRAERQFHEAEKISQGRGADGDISALIVSTDAAFSLYWRDLDRREVRSKLEYNRRHFERRKAMLAYAAVNILLAKILLEDKAYTQALEVCELGLDHCRQVGSLRWEAFALLQHAEIDIARQEAGVAIENIEAAMKIGGSLNHTGILVNAAHTLGQLRLDRGENDAAAECFEGVIGVSQQIDNLLWENNARLGMLRVAMARGQGVAEEIAACEAVLDRLQGQRLNLHAINTLTQLGYTFDQLGEHERAETRLKEALDLEAHDNYPGRSHAQYQLGQLYQRQGRWKEALDYYRTSLKTYAENQDAESQANTLEEMALVFRKQDLPEQELAQLDRAYALRNAARFDNPSATVNRLMRLGPLERLGRRAELIQDLTALEQKFDTPGDLPMPAVHYDRLAIYWSRLEDADKAFELWQKTYQPVSIEHGPTALITAFAQLKLIYGARKTARPAIEREHLPLAAAVLRSRLGTQHRLTRLANGLLVGETDFTADLERFCEYPLQEWQNEHFTDNSAEIIRMLVGVDTIPIFDPAEGSQVIPRIGHARLDLLQAEHFLLPNIRIMDDQGLPERDYIITLQGEELFRGSLPTDFAVRTPGAQTPPDADGRWTEELAYPFPLRWLAEDEGTDGVAKIIPAEDVVMGNLLAVIRREKERIQATIDAIAGSD